MGKHSERALAVARETGWNIDQYEQDHEWHGVGIGPVGRHRDSGTLDRSNFDVIYADLKERFGDRVGTADFGHWGVGWVEEITFDLGQFDLRGGDVREAVEAWAAALEDYPVADDAHHSELEHAEFVQWLETINLEHEDDDGLSFILRPGLGSREAAELMASVLFDECSATRSDDAPDEDRIRDFAVAHGLVVPDVQTVKESLENAQYRYNQLVTFLEDVQRGVRSADELPGFRARLEYVF